MVIDADVDLEVEVVLDMDMDKDVYVGVAACVYMDLVMYLLYVCQHAY